MNTHDFEDIKQEIVQCLHSLDLEKVILFGSYARGEASTESDIDLYIVTKDDFIPSTWRVSKNIYARISKNLLDVQKKIPIDIIVHTKKMSDTFLHINRKFAQQIYTTGVHLL